MPIPQRSARATRAPARSPTAGAWTPSARLACPQCQQTDPRFRAPNPVVQWDRYTAVARTAQVAVAHGTGRHVRNDSEMIPERAGDAFPEPRQMQVPAPAFLVAPRLTERRWPRARRICQAGGIRWLTWPQMAGLVNGTRRSSPDPAATATATATAYGPRIATRTLGAEAGSVRTARDFTAATLRRWGTAERSQDIAIVVSELLTNALRHGGPGSADLWPLRPIRLGLLQPGPCVLCAVADPVARSSSAKAGFPRRDRPRTAHHLRAQRSVGLHHAKRRGKSRVGLVLPHLRYALLLDEDLHLRSAPRELNRIAPELRSSVAGDLAAVDVEDLAGNEGR